MSQLNIFFVLDSNFWNITNYMVTKMDKDLSMNFRKIPKLESVYIQ